MKHADTRFNWLNRQIGIDLGSHQTRVWSNQTDETIVESTCLAIDDSTQKLVAVGTDAEHMSGRVASHIKVVRPVERGLIQDERALRAYLRALLQKVVPQRYFFRPVVMVSVSDLMPQLDRLAIVNILYQIGAREVYTISQSLAAAIGADVPVADASGNFVVHLGHDSVEVSVISFGSVVKTISLDTAGEYASQLIQQAVKNEHGVLISRAAAEKLQHSLASLLDSSESMLISGQLVGEGVPTEITIQAHTLKACLWPLIERYAKLIQNLLEEIPPELTADIIDRGLLLTGGFAQLKGLERYMIEKIGVPATLVEDADLAVLTGIKSTVSHLDLYKESLGYLRDGNSGSIAAAL